MQFTSWQSKEKANEEVLLPSKEMNMQGLKNKEKNNSRFRFD